MSRLGGAVGRLRERPRDVVEQRQREGRAGRAAQERAAREAELNLDADLTGHLPARA